jgi:hypothetical protein
LKPRSSEGEVNIVSNREKNEKVLPNLGPADAIISWQTLETGLHEEKINVGYLEMSDTR